MKKSIRLLLGAKTPANNLQYSILGNSFNLSSTQYANS